MTPRTLFGAALRVLGLWLLMVGVMHATFPLALAAVEWPGEDSVLEMVKFFLLTGALLAGIGLLLVRQWRWLAGFLARTHARVVVSLRGLRLATAGLLGALLVYTLGRAVIRAGAEGTLLDPNVAPALQWTVAAFLVLMLILCVGQRGWGIHTALLRGRDLERVGLSALGTWYIANGLVGVVQLLTRDDVDARPLAARVGLLSLVTVYLVTGLLFLRLVRRGRAPHAPAARTGAWIGAVTLLYHVAEPSARWAAAVVHGKPYVGSAGGSTGVPGMRMGLGTTSSLLTVGVCAAAVLLFVWWKTRADRTDRADRADRAEAPTGGTA